MNKDKPLETPMNVLEKLPLWLKLLLTFQCVAPFVALSLQFKQIVSRVEGLSLFPSVVGLMEFVPETQRFATAKALSAFLAASQASIDELRVQLVLISGLALAGGALFLMVWGSALRGRSSHAVAAKVVTASISLAVAVFWFRMAGNLLALWEELTTAFRFVTVGLLLGTGIASAVAVAFVFGAFRLWRQQRADSLQT